MSGDITRFYKYESSTSATVNKDRINMVIRTMEIDGKHHTGIFLFKEE
ncbi:MAG: hypothetical protein ACTSP9_15420 [Promethearchaeota archaeon]